MKILKILKNWFEACPKTIFAEGLREGAAKFRKIMFLAARSPDFHA